MPLYDDVINTWDTWQTVMPLATTLYPKRARDQVLSFLNRFGYALSRGFKDACIGKCREGAWFYQHPTCGWSQGGHNAGNMMLGAHLKGIEGLALERVYDWMVHHAERVKPEFYRENHYLHRKALGHATGRSLEYNYNDYCVAKVARLLGREEDVQRYLERCRGWVKLWNPEVKSEGFSVFICPREPETHEFSPAFDPKTASGHTFCEASGWVYHFYPFFHDAAMLIEKMGGRERALERFLWFKQNRPYWSWGNEPGIYDPLFGHFLGRPDLTGEFAPEPDPAWGTSAEDLPPSLPLPWAISEGRRPMGSSAPTSGQSVRQNRADRPDVRGSHIPGPSQSRSTRAPERCGNRPSGQRFWPGRRAELRFRQGA